VRVCGGCVGGCVCVKNVVTLRKGRVLRTFRKSESRIFRPKMRTKQVAGRKCVIAL